MIQKNIKMWKKWKLDPSFNFSPESILGWYDKIKTNFTDFKPETRTMTINYGRKTSVIELALKIEDGFRKNHQKIKLPAYNDYQIIRMKDDSFHNLKFLWQRDGNYWVLDASKLPSSEWFSIELEGSIQPNILKDLVHIKPAFNRDSDNDTDKFWLDASIKNPTIIDKMWQALEIQDVNVGVLVDVNKLFGLRMPSEIQDKAVMMQKYLRAGLLLDRQNMFRTASAYRQFEREIPFNPNDFLKIIQNLTGREIFMDYLNIDQPYSIGDIDHPKKHDGILPMDVRVQTLTNLTLKNPQSSGYLIFKRQKYLDRLEDEFGKFKRSKKPKKIR